MRVHFAVRLGAVLMALTAAGCAAAPINKPIKGGPVDTGAGTLTAARQYLEGRWSLQSFQVLPPGRAPVQVAGSGSVTYDEFGNLAMDLRVDDATAKALQGLGI